MESLLAWSLINTAVLVAVTAKDTCDTEPGAWLAAAGRRLRGKKIYVAETGSQEEIDKWVADHDGTTEIPDADRAEIERQFRNEDDQ